MAKRGLLVGIGIGAVVGLGASAATASFCFTGLGSSQGAVSESVARQLASLEAQLEQLEAQIGALTAPEMDPFAVPDPEAAWEEAKRLGIVDELNATRSSLRADTTRRMAVALVQEARRYRLDPLLLTAVARVESAYDPFATSHVGARGLLQVMVVTGRELLESRGEKLRNEGELYDIETNVSLGAEYLARMIDRFGGNLDRALVAYNRGPRGAREALRADPARVLAGYPRLVRLQLARLEQHSQERLALLHPAEAQPAL